MDNQARGRQILHDIWVGETHGGRSTQWQAVGDDRRRAAERSRQSWNDHTADPLQNFSTSRGTYYGGSSSSSGSGLLGLVVIVGLIAVFGGSDRSTNEQRTTPPAEVPPQSEYTQEVAESSVIPEVAEITSDPAEESPAEWTPLEPDLPVQPAASDTQWTPVDPLTPSEASSQAVATPAAPELPPVQLRVVHRVQPVYPPLAREARMDGSVRLSVFVGPDGGVDHVDVISGNPILARAAIDAVMQWRFEPYPDQQGPLNSTELAIDFVRN